MVPIRLVSVVSLLAWGDVSLSVHMYVLVQAPKRLSGEREAATATCSTVQHARRTGRWWPTTPHCTVGVPRLSRSLRLPWLFLC